MTTKKTATATVTEDKPCNHKIVVIQAGWVVTGAIEDRGDHLRVTDGSVIRAWGTTAGLGQLAIEGKQNETVLDPFGTGEVPKLAILFTIDCKAPI